jgi:DNA-binding transcriptional MerR regulator
MTFKPSDVAKELDVSVNTIRNWTRDFDEFLSPEATGQNGNRQINKTDLEVLRTVHQLKREDGLQQPEIALRLGEMHFGEIAMDEPEDEPEADNDTEDLALQGTSQLPALVLTMLRDEITSVREENAQTRQLVEQRDMGERQRLAMLLGGLALGVVLTLAILNFPLA